jgi:hypothetical protein
MKAARLAIPITTALVSVLLLVGGPACNDPAPTHTDGKTGTSKSTLTSCVTIAAAGDASISSAAMDQSFGAQPVLRAGGKDEGLVKFDLGTIPSSAVIASASLKLTISGGGSDVPVNVHRVTTTWNESSVTYASFAQQFEPTVLGSIVASSVNVEKSVDLTSLVASWVHGEHPSYGVLLEAASSKKTIFVSREGGTATQKPALEVCFSVPENHCSPSPCQNGGTCANETSGYTCHCPTGYTGASCETVIDSCASSPCQNGASCTSQASGYTCACPAGFGGTNCETNLDDCASTPCQNGAVCEDGVASVTCHCRPGFAGAYCETLIDNCASQPCLNGATCTNGVNGYACTCEPGFSGTNCEIDVDDCAPGACHNGGVCIDGVNTFTCACPPDWAGATCDVNMSTCSQHPCLNGSACTNGYGTYTCACAPGYTGANCEIDIDDCSPSPCQNGGVCVDGVNAYSCTCPAGFSGATCEVVDPVGCGTNRAPVAEVTPPPAFAIGSGTSITLDASGSSDPDAACGDTLSFGWDLNGDDVIDATGPILTLSPSVLSGLGFVRPATVTCSNTTIARTVRLHLRDSKGATTTSPIVLTGYVDEPIAKLSMPYGTTLVCGFASVTFSPAGSCHGAPNHQLVRFEYDFSYADAATFSPNASSALGGDLFVPASQLTASGVSSPGAYIAALRVTDDIGRSAISTVTYNLVCSP